MLLGFICNDIIKVYKCLAQEIFLLDTLQMNANEWARWRANNEPKERKNPAKKEPKKAKDRRDEEENLLHFLCDLILTTTEFPPLQPWIIIAHHCWVWALGTAQLSPAYFHHLLLLNESRTLYSMRFFFRDLKQIHILPWFRIWTHFQQIFIVYSTFYSAVCWAHQILYSRLDDSTAIMRERKKKQKNYFESQEQLSSDSHRHKSIVFILLLLILFEWEWVSSLHFYLYLILSVLIWVK